MKAVFSNKVSPFKVSEWYFNRLGDDADEYELVQEIGFKIGDPVIYNQYALPTTSSDSVLWLHSVQVLDIRWDMMNGIFYKVHLNEDKWVRPYKLRFDVRRYRNTRLDILDI